MGISPYSESCVAYNATDLIVEIPSSRGTAKTKICIKYKKIEEVSLLIFVDGHL